MKKLHQIVIFLSFASSLSCVGSETIQASTQRFLAKITPVSGVAFALFTPIDPERNPLQPIGNHGVSPIGEKISKFHGVSPIGSPEPTKKSSYHPVSPCGTPNDVHGVSPHEIKTPSPTRPSK